MVMDSWLLLKLTPPCLFRPSRPQADQIFRIIIMPYKSTNKICWPSVSLMVLLAALMCTARGQWECARRPFPPQVPLRANESIIINLDEYFEGSNLTFKVAPNNSFAAIEPTYQCSSAGSQRMGRVIASRYFLQGGEEVVAALAESQFSEGAFSFHLLQVQQGRLTTLNLPKEQASQCSAFAVTMLNSTHFAPTVDCLASRRRHRLLLSAVGQLGSPYADWQAREVPLFSNEAAVVRVEAVGEVLVRAVATATNSYIELWQWSEEARELLSVTDRTKLQLKTFTLRSLKLYGRLLIALDYSSGLLVFRLLPTNALSAPARIVFPFFQEFEYNALTGAVFLAKKGKIVSAVIDTGAQAVALSGEGYNIYKYEHIRKMLITDSALVALGQSTVNIFRRATASVDSRHYSLYPAVNAQMIYTRLVAEGFTVLLLQHANNLLQLSSCRIRAPLLKLATPRSSFQAAVTATSLLDRQQSVCTLNFTLLPDSARQDEIYESGYRLDGEVVYANQLGEGTLDLGKYGLGRDLAYSIRTVPGSILQGESRVRKSEAVNCSFGARTVPPSTAISLVHSWENVVLVQFSDNALSYYVCGPSSCFFATEELALPPVTLLAHETRLRGTNGSSSLLEALLRESDGAVSVRARAIEVDGAQGKVAFDDICSFSLSLAEGEGVVQAEISGGLLYLVLPQRKEVRVHDLREAGCRLLVSLNVRSCPWGYFAPQSVHFNRAGRSGFASDSFLIRQWDEILTVRLENSTSQLQPVLLNRNTLSLVLNYSLIFTAPYLLAFDQARNRTYSFYFDDQDILQYLREVPLAAARFHPSRPASSGFARLIEPRHLALNLDAEGGSGSAVSVFKVDQLISSAQEYVRLEVREEETAVWALVEDEWRLLRVQLASGPSSASLVCRGNATALAPSLQLVFGRTPSTFEEYSENVTVQLATADSTRQHQFKIALSNVGDSIKRGSGFPSRGDSIEARPNITIDDRRWFTGSIFDYEFDCPDCGGRVQFRQKVELEESEPLPLPADSFWVEEEGRALKVLMGSLLVELQYNRDEDLSAEPAEEGKGYSLLQATTLTVNGGRCLEAVPAREHELIALCERVFEDDSKAFYLSLVSTASYKGFVVAEMLLSFGAEERPRLLSKNGLIITYSAETAYLLTLWEVGEQLQFISLDTVDREDIAGRICSLDLAFNASVEAVPLTEVLFSLAVTECSSNLYLSSFVIYAEREEYVDEEGAVRVSLVPNLHVSSAQNVDLLAKFAENRIQIPSEARAVQVIAWRAQEEDQLALLVVYDRFHSYQFALALSRSGVAYNISITSVYYKYGNYEAVSALRGDHLAIKYKSRLLGREERYGFFDVPASEAKGEKEFYTFAGYSVQNTGGDGHEVPWSFVGSTLVQLNGDRLERLRVANQLSARIDRLGPDGQIPADDVLYTQKVQVTAGNVASARSAVIILKAVDRFELSAWQVTLIVIGAIALAAAAVLGTRFAVRRYRKHKKMVPLLEDSLLEDAQLEHEEEERMSGRINLSVRGSVDPQ